MFIPLIIVVSALRKSAVMCELAALKIQRLSNELDTFLYKLNGTTRTLAIYPYNV
jgi:hypothetical protein